MNRSVTSKVMHLKDKLKLLSGKKREISFCWKGSIVGIINRDSNEVFNRFKRVKWWFLSRKVKTNLLWAVSLKCIFLLHCKAEQIKPCCVILLWTHSDRFEKYRHGIYFVLRPQSINYGLFSVTETYKHERKYFRDFDNLFTWFKITPT